MLPTISIITPSLNQSRFIEKTIVSVLSQDYIDIEYIIVDGGSTDGTLEIIKKYEGRLKSWVSEPDSGQSAAINKGFRLAHGDLLAWLNSDDYLYPNALRIIALAAMEHPEAGIIYGDCDVVDEAGGLLHTKGGPWNYRRLLRRTYFGQPATFIRREVFSEVGGLDEKLHNCLDWEYWCRIGLKLPGFYVHKTLAAARMWEGCKTLKHAENARKERFYVLKHLLSRVQTPQVKRFIKEALAEGYWGMMFDKCSTLRGFSRFSAGAKAVGLAPGFVATKLAPDLVAPHLPKFLIRVVSNMKRLCGATSAKK